ncbi:copper-transporting ATPase PAA1, chloroplastic, partial [Tanacetum coccineum]
MAGQNVVAEIPRMPVSTMTLTSLRCFCSLAYLLWKMPFPTIVRRLLFVGVEICWNISPSSVYSSIALPSLHLVIREDVAQVVQTLTGQGINVYLLSGDKKSSAEYVASVVGIPKDQ